MENIRFSSPKPDTLGTAFLPNLLRRHVLASPQGIAVTSGERRMSYAELEQDALRLAACLRQAGVGTDDCVGLYVEPSADLMTGVWGILFAGAAYLPLSPDYPEERLRYMIEDSRTRVVVTQARLVDRLGTIVAPGTRILTVEDATKAADCLAEPDVPSKAESLAYVIYTSGC